jgi:hypothetical protein
MDAGLPVELLALADVDHVGIVVNTQLFQHYRDFVAIGGCQRVQLEGSRPDDVVDLLPWARCRSINCSELVACRGSVEVFDLGRRDPVLFGVGHLERCRGETGRTLEEPFKQQK